MTRWLAAALLLASVPMALVATPSAAGSSAGGRRCSAGLVALTFDDGPSTSVTPRLLDVLESRGVPATFFVVGQRAASAPAVLKDAAKRGFVIGNHTNGHEQLPSLSDEAIRATLRATRRAIRRAGVKPSRLMRPPYGAVNDRVRSVVAGMGLTPVLWDVDPQDWKPRTSGDIAAGVLGALTPHGSNVVLLHDGVGNSPSTLAAVPRIVREARRRGYCFALLDGKGRPTPPVPALSVSDERVVEGGRRGHRVLTFVLTLDRPTSRATSVRVRTTAHTATTGKDFTRVAERVRFPIGVTRRTVEVPVVGDGRDERDERLRLSLARPRDLTIADPLGVGTIVDDDEPPMVGVADAEVMEPGEGTAEASVVLTLDHASGRLVTVQLLTEDGTATADQDFVPLDLLVRVSPGSTRVVVPVTVLSDALDEPSETFTVRIGAVVNAGVAREEATVTIGPLPPP